MSEIEINGIQYKVTETLGFQPSAGVYAKTVDVGGESRMAVKCPRGKWRFWTSRDRTRPLRESAGRPKP